MAIPTTIIPARVKEKVASEEYWLSIENELGPLLDGEIAWVRKDDDTPVNFKIGTGDKLFSELPYFIAYFNNVTNCKTLFYLEQSSNLSIPLVFKNFTSLATVYFINNSGSEQTLKFGTTDGGSEIAELVVPNGAVALNFEYLFTSAQTVYITGLTGVNYSMIILYYQLDEAPVIPSGSEGGLTTLWAPGTVYSFIPLYSGHTDYAWDLITGYGKVGTPYEGAVLFGTNGLPDLSEYYLRGYKNGDTLGGTTGDNLKTIEFENLPELEISLPSNIGGVSGSGGIQFNGAANNTSTYSVKDGDGNPYAGQTEFNVSPKSRIVLYFTGILTT